MPDAPLIVLMGISGSGKSAVGRELARTLGVHFIDGDDLHPIANTTKMAAGIPLTDSDRWPWLGDIGRTLHDYHQCGLVIACSSLRRIYRDAILWEEPDAVFVHLHGPAALIRERLNARAGHFMPGALLESQLDTLEELGPDEPGTVLDIRLPIGDLVKLAVTSSTGVERK